MSASRFLSGESNPGPRAMEGPELATHQGRCDGASAIGDHRGPTHRHALARGPSGPSRERGERDVLGVHPELVHALRHGELPGRSDGSRAGGAAPASPDGIGQGSAMVAGVQEDARRSRFVRTSVSNGRRTSRLARPRGTRAEEEKKKTHISCRQIPRHFGGSQTGEIARQSPDRIRVGNWAADGNLSKLLWFSQLVCLQLPTPVWSGGPTVGGTPTPSPRYPMMMNPSIDASSIDSSIDSSIANSPVRVHELGVKLGELLDDAANVLL